MNIGKTIKNIAYSFGANLFSLLVSVFMVIFVPKFLSLNDYGLWQLFLFYFSYLGFFHFGWEDGIYLRYAGKSFEELDRRTFAGQFYGIIIMQIILAVIISLIGQVIVSDSVKKTALLCAIWLAPLVNFNNLCNFIMQITNRIKDYARLLLTERVVFFLGVIFFLLILHKNEFRYMYYAKLLSVIGITVAGAYLCRSMLYFHFNPLNQIIVEAKKNLTVGSKLMLSNIAGMLIIGIVRYGISMGWDVATFGRVSLTLGISNFLMVFITSVSVVFFPIIKRMDDSKRASTYKIIRLGLDIILFAAMLGYYPLKSILSWWLPKYADSLIYMSVLFPVCVFQSKLNLLVNTFLKSMRQEFLMLKINSLSVLVSIIITFLTVKIFHNLDLAIFSIVVIYAFQCCVAEKCISYLLDISVKRGIITDIIMSGIFIITGWYIQNVFCTVLYLFAYLSLLLMNKKQVKNLLYLIKNRG